MRDVDERSGLASQAKALGTVRNPERSWEFGLLKIPTPATGSGLCSCSLTFGWQSANSSSSSGSRAAWLEEARVMGFEGPAAPLLPAWLASTLPAAFPWDRKEAECYLGHSPSSTKFQHLCLKRALPITLFTTTKFEQVKFTHFKHTATGNCTWAFFFFFFKWRYFLHPHGSEN